MKKHMRCSFFFIFIFFSLRASAQMNEEDVAMIGVRGGYVYSSKLCNLRDLAVSRVLNGDVWQHTVELPRTGYFVSAFGHQRIKNWPIVVQSEFSIAQLGGRVEYNIPDTVFWQKYNFKYLFFCPTLLANIHPFLPADPKSATAFSGIHVGLGGSYNIIIHEHISSVYWDASQNPVQESAANSNFKAISNFALLITGGYDYFWNGPVSGFGLTLDFRAGFGFGDSVRSQAEDIHPDQKVKMKYFMITGGIMVPLIH